MDAFHLNPRDPFTQVFYASGPNDGSAHNNWQPWTKPRGVNFVLITAIAGGGGGGGGFTRAAGAAGGGGGGGGPGSITRLLYQAIYIPDRLYVQPGMGGAGGIASSNGQFGTDTVVSLAPSTSGLNGFAYAVGGTRGSAGATGAGGAGGAAGIAGAASSMSFSVLTPFVSSVSGAAGAAGATNGAAAGSSVSPLSSGVLSGGAGGGGVTVTTNAVSNGGNITGVGIIPQISGGTGNATAPTAGGDGVWFWKPICGSGGAGGGASGTAGVGGFGGRGAFGCGGGGGGSGVTGGTGGDGGGGLVIVSCW